MGTTFNKNASTFLSTISGPSLTITNASNNTYVGLSLPSSVGSNNTSLGNGNFASLGSGTGNIALGQQVFNVLSIGTDNAALGRQAGINASDAVRCTFVGPQSGFDATVFSQLTDSTAIGSGVELTASNQIIIGRSTETTYVPGNLNLQLNGPTNGYVLTSDASGNATWAVDSSTATAWSTFPATQDVDMDGFGLDAVSSFQLTTGATNGYVLTSDASGNATWAAAPSGASTWSTFPATQNVDMDGFGLTDVSSFQLTTGAGSGKILTSDGSGNASWTTAPVAPTVATVSTTDATPTTLATIAVPTGNAITITGTLVARNTAGTINNTTGGRFVATAVNTAGTVTLAGPPDVVVMATSTGTFNVVVSSTNLVVQVTGIAATAYNWSATYTSSSL